MAGKKYTHVRNTIISQNPGPLAPGHSEGAERPRNLVQGRLPDGSGDEPSRSW